METAQTPNQAVSLRPMHPAESNAWQQIQQKMSDYLCYLRGGNEGIGLERRSNSACSNMERELFEKMVVAIWGEEILKEINERQKTINR